MNNFALNSSASSTIYDFVNTFASDKLSFQLQEEKAMLMQLKSNQEPGILIILSDVLYVLSRIKAAYTFLHIFWTEILKVKQKLQACSF